MHDARFLSVCLLLGISGAAQDLSFDAARNDLRAVGDELARVLQDGQASREGISGYRVMRRYVLQNARWNQHAEMTVAMVFEYPNQKHFDLISSSGPEWMLGVFKSLLEAERKATFDGKLALSIIGPQNYDIRIVGLDASAPAETYVADISPKAHGGLMLNGRAWILRKEAAVIRFEGRPSERVSLWVGRPFIIQTFSKVGTLWLPASTRSVAESHLFGRTELTVESFDYAFHRDAPVQAAIPHER